MKSLIFALIICSVKLVNAQSPNLKFSKVIVKHLCSSKMAGRGYQKEGHLKAAHYIEKQFKKIGLKPIGSSYFQKFPIQINSIKNATLKIEGKKLVLGKDYIVAPHSHNGTFNNCLVDLGYGLDVNIPLEAHSECRVGLIKSGLPTEVLASDSLSKQYQKLRSDAAKEHLHEKHIPYFLFQQKKLTASLSDESSSNVVLEVLDSSVADHNFQQVECSIETEVLKLESQNVIASIPAIHKTDTCIVLTAHYDHLGKQGSIFFPGANDNASGIAILLNLATYFQKHPLEHTNLVFIAFGGEEAGLIGSKYFVEHPLIPLKTMKFLINMDLMGNGTEGMMAVGGAEFPEDVKLLQEINKELQALPSIGSRANAPNSDHYFFLKNGVKGFFLYTMGGPSHYHDIYDTPEHLLFSKHDSILNLLQVFIQKKSLK